MNQKVLRALRIFAVYGILILLLWWALRNVPFIEIWETIKQLKGWQILLLLLINAIVIALMAAR